MSHEVTTMSTTHEGHYALVERAIGYIRANAADQPGLEAVAREVGLSVFHLQRVFSQWAGISPKKFLQYVTKESVLERLEHGRSLLDAAYGAGLSGPGRLHDLLVLCEAMTPGEARARGRGVTIGHAFGPTPLGPALVGWTARGVCHLAFAQGADAALGELRARWPLARLEERPDEGRALLERIFVRRDAPVRVLLRGTNFQMKVWEALVKTPPAALVTYADLARAIRQAADANLDRAAEGLRVAMDLVIREGGAPGAYRWGVERKLALHGWERAREDARDGAAAPAAVQAGA
jgi:AraC family transcriptional regulator of adaptative response/methylated-DNA-[protein]-cysteine methyltransferase